MLRELHISNLAVIEDLTVDFGPGLNCFTGQTGAGKSLILGALEVLLGLRNTAATDMLRPGADEARVAGVFELHDPLIARQVGTLLDMTLDAGEQMLITRKFFASGRSSVSVNGQPATAGMVRAIGELLVDIHGQHDHQFLLKPSNQLLILDGFAKATDLRDSYSQLHARYRDMAHRRDELEASRSLRQQQLELYEFQALEIDAVQPVEGEFTQLKARFALLSNLEKVKRDAGQAFAALYESEGAVVERLQMICHVLAGLAELDPALLDISEQVRSSTLTLQEAAFELSRHTERLDLDPNELHEVDQRLNALNRLIAKYASTQVKADSSDALTHILDFRAQLGRRIEELHGADHALEQMDSQMAGAKTELADVGRQLTRLRQAAALRIQPLIERELVDLGMGEAQFVVEFESLQDQQTGSAAGLESIEMMVRTNPGQPARPLRRIASGGELSRIMLAVKSILAQSDRISVLVFDEIDANVGGRMGTVIGQKLRQLAGAPARKDQGGHQVLCITHLPQIAAFADRHLRIAKAVEGKGKNKQTRTGVTLLSGPERIEELAEMLAGKNVTDTTRRQVREMLAAAGN